MKCQAKNRFSLVLVVVVFLYGNTQKPNFLEESKSLVSTIVYPSEADFGIEVMELILPLEKGSMVEIDRKEFFRRLTHQKTIESDTVSSVKFRRLEEYLNQRLEGIKVYREGDVRVIYYITGMRNGVQYIFQTKSIET